MTFTESRRRFLADLGTAGAALAAGPWLQTVGYAAQARGPARALVTSASHRQDFDRRLFGAFLEHLGRSIYTGVYEPESPLADKNAAIIRPILPAPKRTMLRIEP